MVDKNIVGMGWLSIEGGKYTIKKDGLKNSACQA